MHPVGDVVQGEGEHLALGGVGPVGSSGHGDGLAVDAVLHIGVLAIHHEFDAVGLVVHAPVDVGPGVDDLSPLGGDGPG